MNDSRARFADAWNDYAARSDRERPGEEWGDPALWEAWYRELFLPVHAPRWHRAVEIGQGSGKYTERLLDAGCAEILCLDVAQVFLDLSAKLLAPRIDSGQLHLRRIDERDPNALLSAVREQGWVERVDAVFSIDAFVHLPLPNLAAYLRSAALALRPDGYFLCTFADATTVGGRSKLLADIDRTVRVGADPATGCFHFTDCAIVRGLAESLGYEVLVCQVDPVHGRDGQLVARLMDRSRAAQAARSCVP